MNSHWAIDFSPHQSPFYHTHPQEDELCLSLFDEQDGGNRNQNRYRGSPCDFPGGDLSYRRWGQSMASRFQSLAQNLVVILHLLLFLAVHALVDLWQWMICIFCVANPNHLPHRVGCKELLRRSPWIYAVRRRKYGAGSRSSSRRSCKSGIHP
jgi:hypothetical protein